MNYTELCELCRVWLSDHVTKPAREYDARDAQERATRQAILSAISM